VHTAVQTSLVFDISTLSFSLISLFKREGSSFGATVRELPVTGEGQTPGAILEVSPP